MPIGAVSGTPLRRTPTVFVQTPDNVATPPLARRLHDDVRSEVLTLAPLPQPIRAEPVEEPTLFPDEPGDTVTLPVPARSRSWRRSGSCGQPSR